MATAPWSYERLAALVGEHAPEELEAQLAKEDGAVDGALDTAFEHLGGSFNAGNAGNARAVFQHEIATPDGTRHYFVHVEAGTCEAGRGRGPDADLTIAIRLADMLALATGVLSGDDAFKAGKLRLSGNPFIGMKLPEWFDAVS